MEKSIFDNDNRKICISLGFFDCMHLGHRAIIESANIFCRNTGSINAVFTFSNDISSVKSGVKQIYTFDERKILFDECGVEKTIAYSFDDKIRNMSPYDFLKSLTRNYDISAFVCGQDYTFGRNKEGDVKLLKDYCDKTGIKLIVIPELKNGGEKISSTRIKGLLTDCRVKEANTMLGKPYFIRNVVVKGRGEGHMFGIPTANVMVPNDKLLPAKGVYACKVESDGKAYHAVTNVGEKPTFGDFKPTVEALIDDFNGDLYEKTITVSFFEFLRGIKKFSSPVELADTIRNDLKRSKNLC